MASCRVWDNNWIFFRVITHLALERLGGESNQAQTTHYLERLESPIGETSSWFAKRRQQ